MAATDRWRREFVDRGDVFAYQVTGGGGERQLLTLATRRATRTALGAEANLGY